MNPVVSPSAAHAKCIWRSFAVSVRGFFKFIAMAWSVACPGPRAHAHCGPIFDSKLARATRPGPRLVNPHEGLTSAELEVSLPGKKGQGPGRSGTSPRQAPLIAQRSPPLFMRSVRRAALGRPRARVAGFAPPSAVTVRSCHLVNADLLALPLRFLLSLAPKKKRGLLGCLLLLYAAPPHTLHGHCLRLGRCACQCDHQARIVGYSLSASAAAYA